VRNNIGKVHRWMLCHVFVRIVVQGPSHRANISEAMRLLVEACSREFSEDNETTLSIFLMECFADAFKEETP